MQSAGLYKCIDKQHPLLLQFVSDCKERSNATNLSQKLSQVAEWIYYINSEHGVPLEERKSTIDVKIIVEADYSANYLFTLLGVERGLECASIRKRSNSIISWLRWYKRKFPATEEAPIHWERSAIDDVISKIQETKSMVQTAELKRKEQMRRDEQTALHLRSIEPFGDLTDKVKEALEAHTTRRIHDYVRRTFSLEQMFMFREHWWIKKRVQDIVQKKPHEIDSQDEILIRRYCSLDIVISYGQRPAVACNLTISEYCERYVVFLLKY